ncbi:MAG: hypothetical protein J0M17_18590 [Planctomycetes bacterium]|nr:hypothetical protein [Planctomycetota bacterium]
MTSLDGFYVAPFAADGESLGIGFWESAKLSANWIAVATTFIEVGGAAFRSAWAGNLGYVETQLTSQNGAGIATFFVRDQIANSILLLSGQAPSVEQDVEHMFSSSMQRAIPAQSRASVADELGRLSQRPLVAVFVWGNQAISDADHEVVQQLTTHFACAYFKLANK